MFSEQTFAFLSENRFNNSREWFHEHREEYDRLVLEPLKQLAIAVGPTVESIDDAIVTTPRVDKTISRIYRDVRFSMDKSLYRENIWLSFKRDKRQYPRFPEFYFVADRKGFFYGCGYYAPTPEAVASIRERILEGDPFFRKAQKAAESDQRFCLSGELYKRSRYPEQPEPLRRWLDRKEYRVEVRCDDVSVLYSDAFAGQLIADYQKLAPVYRFFLHAEMTSLIGS